MSIDRHLRTLHPLAAALCLAFACAPAFAAKFTVLHDFDGAHGSDPVGRPILDAQGTLYGTASTGGHPNAGVLWRLVGKKYTVLHSFAGGSGDGANPQSSLMIDSGGSLLGTSFAGGSANAGVVYKWDAAAGFSVLLSFAGGAGGSNATAGLVPEADGVMYGTTIHGGDAACDCGTVFKLDPATNLLKTIHTFVGSDGRYPYATLVRGAGVVYGAAMGGGSGGAGTPYTLKMNGMNFTDYAITEGQDFFGGLVRDAQGVLWGTFASGGSRGAGGIYRIDTTGAYSVVHEFNGNKEGSAPKATLLIGLDGLLYGTTSIGGRGGAGTAFKFDPASGQLVTLHSFTGGADGGGPNAGLVQDASGTLYGVAPNGGQFQAGIVFRIVP